MLIRRDLLLPFALTIIVLAVIARGGGVDAFRSILWATAWMQMFVCTGLLSGCVCGFVCDVKLNRPVFLFPFVVTRKL